MLKYLSQYLLRSSGEKRDSMSRFFKYVLAVVFTVAFFAGVALLGMVAFATVNGNSMSDARMDKLTFENTKIVPSNWTGEVVKSEPLGHGLHRVQVRRSGSEKQDTLLATTELAIGTKVQELKILSYGKNTIQQTTWFAVPVETSGK